MKIKWFAFSLLAVSLGTPGFTKARAAEAAPPHPEYSFAQERGQWETPPAEFREVERQGYHDGIEGARRDFDNHRQPDVNNREEYRHPHVEASAREDYREGYRRGYEKAADHLMHRDHDRDYDHDHR
jgi:hypothetical protein